MPRTALIKVVFPAPLGPMMVMISPRCSVRLTRSTTGRSSNRTVRFSMATNGSSMSLLRLTGGAQTGYFQSYGFGNEGFGAGGIVYSFGYCCISQFQGIAARTADKEHPRVVLAGVGTADK